MRTMLVFCGVLCSFMLSCQPLEPVREEPVSTRWFKGNTHVHTVICGHADTQPVAVTRWYHDRGYHFLILSEHNYFIDPDSIELPPNPRPDFILIPGEEVTGNFDIHTTAMNVRGLVHAGPMGPDKPAVMQAHVDSTRQQAGIPILNHPNFGSGAYAADIAKVQRLHLFELYNGHPMVYNWGEEVRYHHVSTEAKWDSLLSGGMQIYGVSSDDAHLFQKWGSDQSNPGRGWVMVRSDTLSPDAMTNAMAKGAFYASAGIILETLEASQEDYILKIDTVATRMELSSPYLLGRQMPEGEPGYRIEFIGKGGKVLKAVDDIAASYIPKVEDGYVRAKLRFQERRGGELLAFYAWTQPVFLTER